MEKKSPIVMANAAGATTSIIYIVCRLLVGVFPDWMLAISQSWFHTAQVQTGANWNLSPGMFILGLISSSISAWLVGYLFAIFYNIFLREK